MIKKLANRIGAGTLLAAALIPGALIADLLWQTFVGPYSATLTIAQLILLVIQAVALTLWLQAD